MSKPIPEGLWELLPLLFRPHPWHGISVGDEAPDKVTAYIEIVPTDPVKYELDKTTGYLKIDRPQKFSNVYPTLYGFLPQTYCGRGERRFCAAEDGARGIVGDGDPLDVCVLSEKAISHGDVLMDVIPIGGLRMIDNNEADDKIVAVLEGDAVYGGLPRSTSSPRRSSTGCKHYFLTYKQAPDSLQPHRVEITHVYGREEAHEVIRRSLADYDKRFGKLRELLTAALKG